jgi:hypothetical protein
MKPETGDDRPWWKKLAWLVVLWAASVAALAAVAWLLRVVMTGVGMTT